MIKNERCHGRGEIASATQRIERDLAATCDPESWMWEKPIWASKNLDQPNLEGRKIIFLIIFENQTLLGDGC